MDFQEEIDLREMFNMLKKGWKIIALITVLAIVISGVISFFILAPVYEASTTMLVGKAQSYDAQVDYQDVLLSQKLVKTYGEIIKKKIILQQVITNENLDLTVEELSEKVSVNPVGDTELIQITVTDRYPLQATKIANGIGVVFRHRIQDIMNVDNVSIIEEATPPIYPIKPNKKLNVAIAAILGLILSVFIIFIKEYLDNTMKTPEDVAKYLDLPVLGSIPQTQE